MFLLSDIIEIYSCVELIRWKKIYWLGWISKGCMVFNELISSIMNYFSSLGFSCCQVFLLIILLLASIDISRGI